MARGILFIGDSGIDHYLDEDVKRPGGCSFNTAYNFHQLDLGRRFKSTLFSPLGDDEEARILLNLIKSLNLSAYTPQSKGPTPLQQIRNDKNGEKKFIEYKAGILESYQLSVEEKELLQNIKGHLVMPCFSQIQNFNRQVLENYSSPYLILDFLDGSDFERSHEKMKPYLDRAWLSFLGLSFENRKLIEDLKGYAGKENKNLIISLGVDGALLIQGSEVYHQKVEPVKEVVDSTGAGDALIGSFLYYFLQTNEWRSSLEKACLYARNILLFKGAVSQ